MDPVTVDAILDATALQYGTSAETYCGYRSRAGGRDVAALLCRRWTTATLRELSGRFGLSHPDSASDLMKRGRRLAESNRDVARKVASIEKDLGLNPESRD
jgi:putative transposase